MNNDLVLNIDQYPGAAMYAKLHNISLKQLVENFLMKFQMPSVQTESLNVNTEEFLDSIDEKLMKKTFEKIHQDYLAGKCKTHEQVMAEMLEKRGWK